MNTKIKITFITGSYPPKVCGVGDYTSNLVETLKESSELDINVFYKEAWSLKFFRQYLSELKAKKSDFYHLQYPTEGYGYSLMPLILFYFIPSRKRVLTIHELSSRNFAAYIYTLLLVFISKKVIVTNELERRHASRFLFGKGKVKVIPIASNMKKYNTVSIPFDKRKIDVAYFGHIRPLKGIETFLTTMSSYVFKNYKIAIIGQTIEKYQSFFNEIRSAASHNEIQLIINKDAYEISEILANVKILYLPFPDGISGRRGSLLAGFQNNCCIVSTKSEFLDFNVFFEQSCYLVESVEEASTTIQKILKMELPLMNLSAINKLFSWKHVSSEHLSIYKHVN